MFFKRRLQNNTRPSVKNVNKFINNSSHKQKKYICLMVIPSYSGGKTRTLRIPRAILYSVIIGIFVVTAVLTGLQQRSNYFQRRAQDLEETLVVTEETFYEFRAYAEQVQDNLIETAIQIYEELNEREHYAQTALDQQARDHRTELEVILEQVDIIERKIREFDDDLQAAIAGLSSRAAIIPPVANLLQQLEESQAYLRTYSLIHTMHDETHVEEVGIGLMSVGAAATNVTSCSVQEYLQILVDELVVQRKLMESFESYRIQMDLYLSNFPTLWPVSGKISSGFGWRRGPFGGGNEHHDGIDIPARTGTHIHAAGGGTVTFSGWRNGHGNTVIIDHGDGMSTLYAHNSRNIVTVGQRVSRGDVIAHVGSTGRSTGPHLHFEVHVNGRPVNPRPFMHEHL